MLTERTIKRVLRIDSVYGVGNNPRRLSSLASETTPKEFRITPHKKEVPKEESSKGKTPIGSIPAMRVLKKTKKSKS